MSIAGAAAAAGASVAFGASAAGAVVAAGAAAGAAGAAAGAAQAASAAVPPISALARKNLRRFNLSNVIFLFSFCLFNYLSSECLCSLDRMTGFNRIDEMIFNPVESCHPV
jgi:hypothetical protein